MTKLNVRIEAHREGSDGPLKVVTLSLKKANAGGNPDFISLVDISEAFNPMPHPISDFAYGIAFSLQSDFSGEERVFATLEAVGLSKEDLIGECRDAVTKWTARRRERSSH